jgi:Hemerythrin HHE cation binding domain
MKATSILIAQHRAIEALFEALARETRRQRRARTAARLAEEIIAHMAGEEAIFYPAVRRVLGDDVGPNARLDGTPSDRSPALVPTVEGASTDGSATDGPAIDPHFMLRAQLRRVLATRVQEPAFQPRSEALRLLFAHHVQAEETGLFPRIEAALADGQLETLGADVLGSRPPIWVVTTEGHALMRSSKVGRGVQLPSVR